MNKALEIAAAKYKLDLISSDKLKEDADHSLAAGIYSKSLAELATLDNPIMSEAGPLFESTLQELSIKLPSPDEALNIILHYHINNIAQGNITPREGMKLVIDEVYYPGNLHEKTKKYVGDSHDIHELLGNFYSYDDLEDRPDEVSFEGKYGKEAKEALGRYIVDLAKKWVEKHSG